MNRQHHARGGFQGIPLTAVYQQLADNPPAAMEEYDPSATVAQLMMRWTTDDATGSRPDPATSRPSPRQAPRPENVLKTKHQPTGAPDPGHPWRNRLVAAAAMVAAVVAVAATAEWVAPTARSGGMNAAADIMAIALFVFFAVGVAVGGIVVIALSARRADKADRWNGHARGPTGEPRYYVDDKPDDDSPWWQTRGDY